MAIFVNGKDHKWEFENVGGTSRVKIRNGADIAHLKYLDPKLWTVLSCPVKGLEIDEKSLSYIDADGDGKIRVNDVVKTATWVTDAVNNDDMVLNEEDFIYIRHFDTSNEVGLRLYNTSRQILDNLGKREPSLSIAEVTDMATIFANTRFNGDGVVTVETAEEPEDKAAIVAAVTALGGVKDRCGELGVNNEMIEKFYNCLNAYDA